MTAPGAPIRTGGRTIEPEWRDLLDDATASVDPQTEHEIRAAMEDAQNGR